jgi:hypothetical protein
LKKLPRKQLVRNKETDVEDIQVTLISGETPTSARDLENEPASKLVMIPGIKDRATGMKDYDHGVSFPDNLSESQGDRHSPVCRSG